MSAVRRHVLLLAAAVVTAALGGCATTRIVSAWRDPALASVPFRKVLVAFQTRDPGLRRVLEDEMAASIPNATPAYRVVSDEEVRDVPLVKRRVKAMGFDSAVVMRVVGVEHEQTYVPGHVYTVPGYYRDFWGYWGYGWGTVYEPGYLRNDRIVEVATNVYSVPPDKLVWASQSETFNPRSLRGAVREVVQANARAIGDMLTTRGR